MSVLGQALSKSILGSKPDETIKSGTMVVTRGIGVIAVALIGTFLLMDQLGDVGPWAGLDTVTKLKFVIASGALWAVVAGADAIARGLATGADAIARGLAAARKSDFVATLPPGLSATKIEGVDDPGWTAVAARFAGGAGAGGPIYLIVKPGHDAEWLPGDRLKFG